MYLGGPPIFYKLESTPTFWVFQYPGMFAKYGKYYCLIWNGCVYMEHSTKLFHAPILNICEICLVRDKYTKKIAFTEISSTCMKSKFEEWSDLVKMIIHHLSNFHAWVIIHSSGKCAKSFNDDFCTFGTKCLHI